MEKKFEDLPKWTFWIDEVSVGHYKVKGTEETFGANLDLTGEDPENCSKRLDKLPHKCKGKSAGN